MATLLRLHWAVTALTSLLVAQQAHCQMFEYAVFHLELLNDINPHTWTRAINDQGVIVGSSHVNMNDIVAVAWDGDRKVHSLGALAGSFAEGRGINEALQVVGKSQWPEGYGSDTHAFFWSEGVMLDLGTLGGEESEANAINDFSLVVGQSQFEAGSTWAAFVWQDGVMSELPGLERGGIAYDINNKDQIVGKAFADNKEVAVLWQDGEIIALPSLDGGFSSAMAINDLGQIVGQSDKGYDDVHAVAWINGKIHDLHNNKAGKNSSAWGINNSGQVVGWVGTPPLNNLGFVWDAANGMRHLDDLVPPLLPKRWVFDLSYDINNAGQVAANGYEEGNRFYSQPFLLSPIYPSFDLSLVAPGIGGQVNTITASNLVPGTKVYFTWGRHGGGAMIPGCAVQTNALQIDKPKITGSAVADENGIATLEGLVPVGISNQWLLFQAVVPGDCAVSNLVVQKFE